MTCPAKTPPLHFLSFGKELCHAHAMPAMHWRGHGVIPSNSRPFSLEKPLITIRVTTKAVSLREDLFEKTERDIAGAGIWPSHRLVSQPIIPYYSCLLADNHHFTPTPWRDSHKQNNLLLSSQRDLRETHGLSFWIDRLLLLIPFAFIP